MKNPNDIPEEYRPLSMWAYFGYNILYSIPLIGWIFLIIFALDGSNINRRNFSRSYFVVFIICAVFLSIAFISGTAATFLEALINR